MARKKQPVVNYVMFDVFYQDGSRTSHRKVPAAEPHEVDYDARIKALIEAQDREIAEKSGLAPMTIKSLHRSGEKPKLQMGAALRASRGGRHP